MTYNETIALIISAILIVGFNVWLIFAFLKKKEDNRLLRGIVNRLDKTKIMDHYVRGYIDGIKNVVSKAMRKKVIDPSDAYSILEVAQDLPIVEETKKRFRLMGTEGNIIFTYKYSCDTCKQKFYPDQLKRYAENESCIQCPHCSSNQITNI